MNNKLREVNMKFIDTVCGMEVAPDSDYYTDISDERYFFCSESCQLKFDQKPDDYIDNNDVESSTESDIKLDTMKQIDIPVIGMNCATCAVAIEKEVNKNAGLNHHM